MLEEYTSVDIEDTGATNKTGIGAQDWNPWERVHVLITVSWENI